MRTPPMPSTISWESRYRSSPPYSVSVRRRSASSLLGRSVSSRSVSTSAPEMLVSLMASLQGASGLAVGNAIGSNIANIALVLGATAVVMPIDLRSETLRREMPALLAITLLGVMLFLDGYLSRLDGFVLLGGLVLLMYWITKLGFRSPASDPIQAEYAAEIPTGISTPVAIGWLALGLAVLLLGSNLLVWGAESIARAVGVSDLLIGLTIVAVGTSLPELAVSIVSALKNEHGLAIGNIIGSNMFNTLAVLGISGVAGPAAFETDVLNLHLPVMIGFTLVLFTMAYDFSGRGRVNRVEGGALLIAFAVYQYYIFAKSI